MMWNNGRSVSRHFSKVFLALILLLLVNWFNFSLQLSSKTANVSLLEYFVGFLIRIQRIMNNFWIFFFGVWNKGTNSNFDSKETQCDLFRKQIEIVCDLKQAGNNKPLILNDLEDLIGEEFLKILKENKNRLPNVLLNRCNGTSEQIRQYLELGFYLGLSGLCIAFCRLWF